MAEEPIQSAVHPEPEEVVSTVFDCGACGAEVSGNVKKCPKCGRLFDDIPQAKEKSLVGLGGWLIAVGLATIHIFIDLF